MVVIRAKTVELFSSNKLTERQKENYRKYMDDIKHQRIIAISYPRRVVLELTNSCNLRCIMCGRDESEFNSSFLNPLYLSKIEPILDYVEEVSLVGWGEPTIHPNFKDILKSINKFPVHKYFVTNGMMLKRFFEDIFEYKVDIIAVSVDGATAETNNRIRVKSDFNQIISNLKSIVQKRKEKEVNYPYINFVFTAMKSNIHELPDMVNLAYKIGIEEVKVVYLTVFSQELLKESLWNCRDKVEPVFAEAEKRANTLGIKIKLPYLQGSDIAGKKYHKDCFVGWRDFFVGSDGFVRPCHSTAMKFFNLLKYNTFNEMWNSKEYQYFRDHINNPDIMPIECKRCYQSSHANWNRKESFIQIGEQFSPYWEKEKL